MFPRVAKFVIPRGTRIGSEWLGWVHLAKYYHFLIPCGIQWSLTCRMPIIVSASKNDQIHHPPGPGTGSWHPDVASMACYFPRWTHDEISWSLTCRKARIRRIALAAFIRITGISSGFLAVSDVSDVIRVGQFTVVYKKYCKNKTFSTFLEGFLKQKNGKAKTVPIWPHGFRNISGQKTGIRFLPKGACSKLFAKTNKP